MCTLSGAAHRRLRRSRAHVVLIGLAMLLLGSTGVQASPAEQPGTPLALAAQETGPGTDEPLWEFTEGRRHLFFNCPEGYPTTGLTLLDLWADCELVFVSFCLDLQASPWQPPLPQRGCDDRPRS
ncbi:MAG TPA: hypothetical protein VD767_07415 [Thermomicrobiales bacterium]|nr:hypothetical protein [Thermomicrobiales bacterium]